MTRYMLPLLLLLVNPVMAEEHCLKPKTDYQRGCAAITNLQNLPTLSAINDCAIITIDARSHWNASGLRLEKNASYEFQLGDDDVWCDASIVSNYKGWQANKNGASTGGTCPAECSKCKPGEAVTGPLINKGKLANALLNASGWMRRTPESRYFALIGLVRGELYEEAIDVSKQNHITPKADAELCAYANDLSFMYGNNSGTLTLKVKRIK